MLSDSIKENCIGQIIIITELRFVDEVLRTGLAYCRPDAAYALGGFLSPTHPVLFMLTEANKKASDEKFGSDK